MISPRMGKKETNINILWVEERSLTHMFQSWKVAGHPTETVQVQ